MGSILFYVNAAEDELPGVDEYTKLMLHMNGIDDGTTFVDSSPSDQDITYGANAVTKTGIKKFGSASGYFDGASYFTVADSTDWDMSGEYTIDLWFKRSTIGASQFLLSQFEDASNRWNLAIISTGGIAFKMYSGGVTEVDTGYAGNVEDTNWHHAAVVKTATYYAVYLDGVEVGRDTTTYTQTYSSPLVVGRYNLPGAYWHGYMDEIRISKGVARWTENFTPPTEEYTP